MKDTKLKEFLLWGASDEGIKSPEFEGLILKHLEQTLRESIENLSENRAYVFLKEYCRRVMFKYYQHIRLINFQYRHMWE